MTWNHYLNQWWLIVNGTLWQTPVKFSLKYTYFSSRKFIWKCCMDNSCHFIPVPMCQTVTPQTLILTLLEYSKISGSIPWRLMPWLLALLGLSNHGIDYAGLRGPCPPRRTSTICALFVLKNYEKKKNMLLCFVKQNSNSVAQGLNSHKRKPINFNSHCFGHDKKSFNTNLLLYTLNKQQPNTWSGLLRWQKTPWCNFCMKYENHIWNTYRFIFIICLVILVLVESFE